MYHLLQAVVDHVGRVVVSIVSATDYLPVVRIDRELTSPTLSTLLVTDFKEYLSQQLKKKPAVQEGGCVCACTCVSVAEIHTLVCIFVFCSLDFVDFQAMFQPTMKESDGEDTPHVSTGTHISTYVQYSSFCSS